MSDMPEEIWAYTQSGTNVRIWRSDNARPVSTAYRRADLPPTQEALALLTSEQIMADPRVMALVEALKGALDELQECSLIICGEDYNSPSHNAALAALTDNEGETE